MRIKIGRHFWEIVTVKELPENDGETRFNSGALVPRQIALCETDEEMRYTLFHELIHAASFDERLGLNEKQVLGLERWFKKFEKNHDLSELLDAYGELPHKKNKQESTKKCT